MSEILTRGKPLFFFLPENHEGYQIGSLHLCITIEREQTKISTRLQLTSSIAGQTLGKIKKTLPSIAGFFFCNTDLLETLILLYRMFFLVIVTLKNQFKSNSEI